MKRKISWSSLAAMLACLMLAFTAPACGGSGADIVKKLEGFAKSCEACKDKACATGVWDGFITYAKANKSASGNEENKVKAQAAAKNLAACSVKKGIAPTKIQKDITSI